MTESENATLNRAFMRLARRSERVDRGRLVDTFVNVGPLLTLVSSDDHQIIFGRRGTGKTHVLNYLSDIRANEDDVVIYVDLSNIGSSGGIYADPSLPVTERATRLLVDTLLAVHDTLYDHFVDAAERHDLSRTGPLLDRFGDTITEVRVVGEISTSDSRGARTRTKRSSGTDIGLSGSSVDVGLRAEMEQERESEAQEKITRRGNERHSVHFGSARRTWEEMIEIIQPRRVWLLLDEWSSVPIELQPYLADLVRRSIFPVRGVTVKIAAIEQRAAFSLPLERGNYLGIEVGADAAADVNLDDFMVFDNDSVRARAFYRSLLYKHLQSTDVYQAASIDLRTEVEFLRLAFTQVNTFDELVRASEGVPRDAINIVIQAAQYAGSRPIAVEDVRRAAHAWYQRDKEAAVRSSDTAAALLHWIIKEVIAQRRARAFLLRSDAKDPLIETLFDSRVLHILKRNISTHDEPGTRYHVYKLDYGCYVDLIATARAPAGLFKLDTAQPDGSIQYVEVPPDDYRAIRRAVLRVEDFYQRPVR